MPQRAARPKPVRAAAPAQGRNSAFDRRRTHEAGVVEAAHHPEIPGSMRLSKRMSELGIASRREADDWIDAGWVKVDGEIAVLGARVFPHQRIEIDPRARSHQAQRVTILLHKPIGYVSGQAEDGYEPARVLVTPEHHWSGDASRIDFHRGHLAHLVPAGRLDIDSTGLLVLTQDGRVARHLIGDDSKVEKEYLVRVAPVSEGSVHADALRLLNHGLTLDERPLKPARVSWANEDQLRFVLREGRKRQIRRMCELVGLKVTGLKRVRIGSVVLGKLPLGQWRYLAPGEKF
jgi:23S rRNA pseudouridine2604 synthase